MVITIRDYPYSFKFTVDEAKAPPPSYGCQWRTAILHYELDPNRCETHAVEDYIVEAVKRTKDGEEWIIGS